jgi:hypothetical protein
MGDVKMDKMKVKKPAIAMLMVLPGGTLPGVVLQAS